ncbi:hypothetical protein VTH06DRAFT_5128 [Thermothelomyces fergusii]
MNDLVTDSPVGAPLASLAARVAFDACRGCVVLGKVSASRIEKENRVDSCVGDARYIFLGGRACKLLHGIMSANGGASVAAPWARPTL